MDCPTCGNYSCKCQKKPLRQWLVEELQEWFKALKYASIAEKFLGIDGADITSFSKKDFQEILESKALGIALYNAFQDLGTFVSTPKLALLFLTQALGISYCFHIYQFLGWRQDKRNRSNQ